MPRPPINPKEIDWSGENPGMTLKTSPDGETTCLVSFFRVVVSPHGVGHAVFILTDPSGQDSGAVNACYSDNEPLARYLLRDFVSKFGAWKGNPCLENLPFKPADSFTHSGDTQTSWTERITGPGVDIALTWRDFTPPFMVEYGNKEQSATGQHEMFSLFVPSRQAEVVANGVRGRGVSGPRDMYSKQSTTTFLAFSETWIKA